MENLFNSKLDSIIVQARRSVTPDMLADYIVSAIYLDLYKNEKIKGDQELLAYAKNTINLCETKEDNKVALLVSQLNQEEKNELIKYAVENSFYKMNDSSTELLSEFVFNLFGDIEENSTIYDACAGKGNFLLAIYNQENSDKVKSLIGTELNAANIQFMNIMFECLSVLKENDIKLHVKPGNAMIDDLSVDAQYTYIYPPFGLRFLMKNNSIQSKLFKEYGFTSKNTSEWIFLDNILSQVITTNKKLVMLVTQRALFNDADKEYRNLLLENGFIEGMIELPSGSLKGTTIKTIALIISSGNNEVKYFDASECIKKKNTIFSSETDYKRILECYNSPKCENISVNKLISKDNLCPSTLNIKDVKFKNGVKLGKVAEVFTGSQYTSKNFENAFSKEPTGYRILTSSDITGPFIDINKLHSVDLNDKKIDKFAVQKDDLVITSKSSKFKTVVIDVEPKEKIIVTGGMIVVRPDSSKLNTTYLKMFLDSRMGQLVIKKIQKGSTIITINSKDLSNIEVPLIDIESQSKKAEIYNDKVMTIAYYLKEIEKIENSLSNIFEED